MLVVVVGCVYTQAGLREYMAMRMVVGKLTGQQRVQAEESFGTGSDGYYGGALTGRWGMVGG